MAQLCPGSPIARQHALIMARRGASRETVGFRAPDSAVETGACEELLLDRSPGHALIVGPSGSGKTRNVAIPNCLWYLGSLFALDIKGELAETTVRRRRELGQQVHVLDPFGITHFVGAGINPLDLPDPASPEFEADCWMIVRLLTAGQMSLQDRFWDQSAEALLAAVIAYHIEFMPPENRNLAAVRTFLCNPDLSYQIETLLQRPELAASHGLAADEFRNFLGHEGEKVRTSIRSTAMQHLSIFNGSQIVNATSTSTFDLDAITRGERISIYLVVPPHRLESFAALVRLWIAVVMTQIMRRTSAPDLPTLFLLDEVAQLGSFPLLRTAVTLLRGYGVRCMMFVQDVSQLRQLFPSDHATIVNNCSTVATLGHASYAMSRELSDLLGDICADDLFAMDGDTIAVRQFGQRTARSKRVDYLKDDLFAGQFDRPRMAPIGPTGPGEHHSDALVGMNPASLRG
ncbi:type IV secretion system protein VirD4 [Sphingomonas kyeonggiensis]|uniref:type IV secretory system conjugative DNA transfer family protein n=1 Tax=Sphingomonas kyeonggiensis TaxID=1268553 RepID=UPI00278AD370|nr:type IV secretory system conjugative DNA transfer family protein [Sphingomonas kyeonggiensis]MDQ0248407.1 type IV secretion system protein VirD4 [Sphingomonas kyeonggiensis]